MEGKKIYGLEMYFLGKLFSLGKAVSKKKILHTSQRVRWKISGIENFYSLKYQTWTIQLFFHVISEFSSYIPLTRYVHG